MGIFEILIFLIVALIVIPPDDLPQVMRAVGKVMRELRLASNTVMREISGAIGDDSPFNILPPRFDDPHPPAPSTSPSPAPPAFLAPEPKSWPPAETAPPSESEPPAASLPQASIADSRTGPEGSAAEHPNADPLATHTATAAEHQPSAELPPSTPASTQPEAPEHPARSLPPDDKP